MAEKEVKYNEDSIRTLEWNEHIRLRPVENRTNYGQYICYW